ncbi:RNA transcription, translation and transport factor protein isoform X2 [Nematostella vectensis]|uniref:RNA transcription, translation and transport factor protein isoform X2 n=1 Tax=Nematostella vectensis TaxID=45351 RepID=UPI0020778BD2|nr:RNA transcription, translation and transport factor protein isoform X2 [Nematostella vectensis]
MFRRKLAALEYHHPDNFNIQNEDECRNLVVWLEDQKIRLYRIEDRESLRDIGNATWPKTLMKYLDDLQCPLKSREKSTVLDWLLAHAIRLEYADNAEKYNSQSQRTASDTSKTTELTEALLNLTADDADLKAGVLSVARLLNLPEHHDPYVLLQAIKSLVGGKLTQNALREAKAKKEAKEFKSSDVIALPTADLGFNTGGRPFFQRMCYCKTLL